MKIEFIKANEDHTWDTEIIEVPNELTLGIDYSNPKWDSTIIEWAQIHLAGQTQYQKIVYWGIYDSDPECPESF